ncbi:MAG: RDD family protein [Sphingomonadales bacterium]|jgi:uncharacterized RDD family membrane protein YckC
MSDLLSDDLERPIAAEYVGFWKRVLSFIIDGIIIMIPVFILVPKDNMAQMFGSDGIDPSLAQAVSTDLAPYSLAITVGYFLGFWAWKQTTLGLMIFGARIADADTLGKPGVDRLLRRVILFALPGLLSFASTGLSSAAELLFYVSCAWAGIDERKQALHDKIGGTVVIKK